MQRLIQTHNDICATTCNTLTLVHSTSIGATKVPKSLNISATRKCIMGGAFLNHMISTQHLGKEYVKKILENKDESSSNKDTIELASEIKIAITSF